MNTKVLAPLSGAVFVAIWLAVVFGVGGTGTPDAGASGGELLTFYGGESGRQTAAAFLLAASVPFLLVFVVQLARLRPAAAGGDPLDRRLLLAGGTLTGAATLLLATVHMALATGADEGLSGGALEALNLLDSGFWMAFNPALGVLMLGAAGVLRSAAAPAWLAWPALVLGIAAFIPIADFFALLLTAVWIVVVAIRLAAAARADATAAPRTDLAATA